MNKLRKSVCRSLHKSWGPDNRDWRWHISNSSNLIRNPQNFVVHCKVRLAKWKLSSLQIMDSHPLTFNNDFWCTYLPKISGISSILDSSSSLFSLSHLMPTREKILQNLIWWNNIWYLGGQVFTNFETFLINHLKTRGGVPIDPQGPDAHWTESLPCNYSRR